MDIILPFPQDFHNLSLVFHFYRLLNLSLSVSSYCPTVEIQLKGKDHKNVHSHISQSEISHTPGTVTETFGDYFNDSSSKMRVELVLCDHPFVCYHNCLVKLI